MTASTRIVRFPEPDETLDLAALRADLDTATDGWCRAAGNLSVARDELTALLEENRQLRLAAFLGYRTLDQAYTRLQPSERNTYHWLKGLVEEILDRDRKENESMQQREDD